MPERITNQLIAVLSALLADEGREWYGLELMQITGLSSGTLYPILHRLVGDGWLIRTREAPSAIGGSGRRLYELTGVGELAAREVLDARSRRVRSAGHGIRPGAQPA